MSQFRRVRTDFWRDPIIAEEMTTEDRYFLLYLLTNPQTTHNGRYKISEEKIAHEMGYSIESIHSLLDRMIHHHQVIRYNSETKEIVVNGWDEGTGTISQSVASENMA